MYMYKFDNVVGAIKKILLKSYCMVTPLHRVARSTVDVLSLANVFM